MWNDVGSRGGEELPGDVELSPGKLHGKVAMLSFVMDSAHCFLSSTLVTKAGWIQDIFTRHHSSASCLRPPPVVSRNAVDFGFFAELGWPLRNFARRFLNHTCDGTKKGLGGKMILGLRIMEILYCMKKVLCSCGNVKSEDGKWNSINGNSCLAKT